MFLKKKQLVVYGVVPIKRIMIPWPRDKVVLNALLQQCAMEIDVYFVEEIGFAAVEYQGQNTGFHRGD